MSPAPRRSRRAAVRPAARPGRLRWSQPVAHPFRLGRPDSSGPAHRSRRLSTRRSPPPSASAGGVVYVVVGGDTLFSIARAWGTTVAQLQAWNAERYPSLVTNPDGLEAGWVLIVAGDPSATPVATSVALDADAGPHARPPPVGSGCRAGNRVAAGSPQTFYTVPGAGHARGAHLRHGRAAGPGRRHPELPDPPPGVRHPLPDRRHGPDRPRARRSWPSCEAHPELFEIGNHTMHHCDLVHGGLGSPTTAPCAGGAADAPTSSAAS